MIIPRKDKNKIDGIIILVSSNLSIFTSSTFIYRTISTPSLKLNCKYIFFFISSDAMDGFGITECGSLACLSNPCRNGAICIEKDDYEESMDNNEGHHHYYNDVNVYGIKHQKDLGDKWKCKCPTGYMGLTCEISICDNNPCQYGGTCVTFPGSGYLCLCPLGKHGHYCEHSKYKIYIYIFFIVMNFFLFILGIFKIILRIFNIRKK